MNSAIHTTIETTDKVSAQPTPAAGSAPRYNIYTCVHKGLRGLMMDTLGKFGRMDLGDDCEFATVTRQTANLLALCRSHVHHENDFLHPALETLRTGSSTHTRDDHVGHLHEIDALESQLADLQTAPASERKALAHALYLTLSVFVADNFAHMNVEETANHAVLIAGYSDEELLQLEGRIVASMPAEENQQYLQWMFSYMSVAECAFTLNGIRFNAPPDVFQAVLGLARETLSQRDFFKLERALA